MFKHPVSTLCRLLKVKSGQIIAGNVINLSLGRLTVKKVALLNSLARSYQLPAFSALVATLWLDKPGLKLHTGRFQSVETDSIHPEMIGYSVNDKNG
ncbi:hypothetical protein [Pantoea vagans]|uniref:hypothetical protein n=1 Tax=Pantoea vagans TaxID=470934 RepID=UPI0028EFFE3F|nr:hypothetical protein [Pantoea vagans]